MNANFDIREYVSPEAYAILGNSSIWLMDLRIISFKEWLEQYLSALVVVNDWHKGGQYHQSGFRIPADQTSKAVLTQHKFGRAIDMKAKGYDPEQIRQIIRDNYKSLNARFGITCIELDCPTWAHADCRWTGLDHLLEVPFK